MKALLVVVAIVLAFAAGSKFSTVRHDLAERRAVIASQWSQVDLAMKERAELIATLAGAPRDQGPELAAIRNEISSARTALEAAQKPEQKIRANERLSGALARLLQMAKAHPRWLENQEFAASQDELSSTGDRIAEEREKYNGALEHYNARIQTFPDNIVAALSGYDRVNAYFQTGGEVR